ncbi:LysM peptidoglycan-binding domain-containing protein [Streptacidiphilus rugosus]|uniref:LysM peptidoglycan-binding domain-containing protein n=1 Tax=Streptacidiphilus rugosus TaxID=405783 RepID=UPI00068D51AD|nr:transglycosylase family protein [Streptacidiphilus rugosus]
MGIGRKCLIGSALGGSAALLGLLPPVADAASDRVGTSVWDRLAMCESSGRWHVNTGNGYYGGVQISLETWKETGGRRYASRPDLASKAQQIVIAEKILAWQGWDAWPSCSRDLGLSGRPTGGKPPVAKPPAPKPPTPKPPVAQPPTGTPPVVTVPATYTVASGDSLASIAHRFQLQGGWPALYDRNRALIGPNPDNLNAGTVLRLR